MANVVYYLPTYKYGIQKNEYKSHILCIFVIWIYKSCINDKVNIRQDVALDPYLPYPLGLTHGEWWNAKGIPYHPEKPHFLLTRLKMVQWGALFFSVFLLPIDPSWVNWYFMGPTSPDSMGKGQLSHILPAVNNLLLYKLLIHYVSHILFKLIII